MPHAAAAAAAAAADSVLSKQAVARLDRLRAGRRWSGDGLRGEREGGTMVAAGGVVRCRWTAVAVVLMMACVAVAAGSGSEGSNETRATWEVRLAAPAAYMHKLVAPLLLCVGRRLLIRPD